MGMTTIAHHSQLSHPCTITHQPSSYHQYPHYPLFHQHPSFLTFPTTTHHELPPLSTLTHRPHSHPQTHHIALFAANLKQTFLKASLTVAFGQKSAAGRDEFNCTAEMSMLRATPKPNRFVSFSNVNTGVVLVEQPVSQWFSLIFLRLFCDFALSGACTI